MPPLPPPPSSVLPGGVRSTLQLTTTSCGMGPYGPPGPAAAGVAPLGLETCSRRAKRAGWRACGTLMGRTSLCCPCGPMH
eukprot:14725637-Alexandrium_andersonii.AAC.1